MGDVVLTDENSQDVDYTIYDADGWPIESSEANVANQTLEQLLAAFLFMIRACEHVYPRDVENDAAYNIFYGGSVFTDMSDHPVLTGEMVGVPLPAEMCINAGYLDGKCVSTAAGAYQITKPTWISVRNYGGSPIPAFDKAGQDEAARRILQMVGALPRIYAGDIPGAIVRASARWASLPGNKAKQNQRSMDYVMARFNEGIDYA